MRGLLWAWGWGGLLVVPLCQAAEPAPVQAGLWEVRSLTTFDRAAAAGLQAATLTQPEPSQPHAYAICLAEPRVRAPMMPPRLPRTAELAFDVKTIVGSFTEPVPGSTTGAQRQVEFAYRRLGPAVFEGSQDVQTEGRIVRLQYYAQRVSANCGAVKPSLVQGSGEP
jgi:hypothetical protein